jgi:hypothetical protein
LSQTATLPVTWQDLLALDPQLEAIDELLDRYYGRITNDNCWSLYARAKAKLRQRVGWSAKDALPELQTEAAYLIGMTHLCQVLGI